MKRTVILTIFTLLVFSSNLWAQVDISGKWAGTCKSSLSGSTFDAEADFTQSGNDVSGTITVILPFADMLGEVDGTVSGNNFTGTWLESTGDCPDPTQFTYEISTDWNTMTGELLADCPPYGGEITYQDFILERANPVTSTSSSSSTSSSTTTAPSQPCPAEKIYGEDSGEVQLLRLFRDASLSETPEGQELIRLYYEWSPVVVKAIEDDENTKMETKKLIDVFLQCFKVR